jgi:hypothetical protein
MRNVAILTCPSGAEGEEAVVEGIYFLFGKKEQLALPLTRLVLRPWLELACWSWFLPSSEEALHILRHYMKMYGYVSNMVKGI